MNIFITGGTGYLGSKLAGALAAHGHSLFFLVRRSSDLTKLSGLVNRSNVFYDLECDFVEIFAEEKVEMVVHCATHYGRNDSNPLNTINSNLLMPLRLLDAAAKVGLSAFISTGTMLDKRVSFYSLSKSQFDDWMQQYSPKIKCINLLLEHFYGPGDDPSKFVSAMINQLIAGVKSIDLTLGMQKRDFIYIDDVVDAFLAVISKIDEIGQLATFEVGSGLSVAIKEFMTLAKKIADNNVTELNFGAIPYRENEVMNSRVDTTLLRNIGWSCTTSLTDGLRKTIWSNK